MDYAETIHEILFNSLANIEYKFDLSYKCFLL